MLATGRSKVSASLMEVYNAAGEMPFHVLTTKELLKSEEKQLLRNIDPRSQLFFCELESGNFDAISHSHVLSRIGTIREGLPSFEFKTVPTHTSQMWP